ncbi:hypothetical protein ACHQM5_009180 [Ranunculus cassubicifolius]
MAEEGSNRKKILVAIDESECSRYALQWTLDYLRGSIPVSSLFILTVQSLEDLGYLYAASLGSAPPDLVRSVREHQNKAALTLLDRAKEICLRREVTPMTVTEFGEPKEVVCEAIEKHKIDLLVLGSHGKVSVLLILRVCLTFLGSVSNYCVHNAKCAVLVVRKPI